MKNLLSCAAMLASIIVLFASCESHQANAEQEAKVPKYAPDPHSQSNPNEVAITHLDLFLDVDFDKRMLTGKAVYQLERNKGNVLRLDVRDLNIQSVLLGAHEDDPFATFRILPGDSLGAALEIELNDSTTSVSVHYQTSPSAAALLWLRPGQTHDKTMPFLFTQGQAILTRSWIPIQDSPALRITYNAKVRTPKGMMAVMSAENPTEISDNSFYEFRMEQPIPPYLMALAVGSLEFAPLGARSGVYAEPGMLQRAAYEFEDVEQMITAAEGLYGKYAWGRYDILVLPPSFPFGGMENPRLTFVTPTIIAGDKSLTALVAHELAHSWSGNLVTNASWDDFWLNEGFTVYFENRIMEAVKGKEYAAMLQSLGYQDLLHTIDELGPESADTHLKLDLEGRDPDEGMNDVAYEKGYLILRWLEEQTGREVFDAFLRDYFERNAFKTMTTERFVAYLDSHLLQNMEPRPDVEAWIYNPGLPEGHPAPTSDVFGKIDSHREQWLNGSVSTTELPTSEWTTHEWLHFLRALDGATGVERLASLDAAYNLSNTGNAEIASAWFQVAIHNDYQPAFSQLEDFLVEVGRRKFLKPLYEALSQREDHLQWALAVYEKARPNYHAVSVGTIDGILYGTDDN